MSLNISACYDANGQVRANDIPCDPYAEVSTCCGVSGSICVDNLHCLTPENTASPGTCTDPTWASSGGAVPGCSCPGRYIENQVLSYLDSVTFCSDGGYCCGSDNFDCCNDGRSQHIIDYGQSDVVLPSGTAISGLSTYYTGLEVSTVSITRSSHSTAATAVVTTTVSVLPTTTSESSGSPSLSAGAGAGIGVGVGIIATTVIAGLVFIFLRRRKTITSPQQDPPYPSTTGPYGPQLSTTLTPYPQPQSFHEAPGQYPAHEMQGNHARIAELGGRDR